MARGPRQPSAVAAGVVGAAAIVLLAVVAQPFAAQLWHKDALDYAQIARELAAGRGFASRQAIYALHLRFLAEHGLLGATWPNLHRFPLQAAVLAPAFAAFGASDATALWTCVLLAAATAALLFRFADAAIGRWAAAASFFVFIANGTLAFEVGAGIPEPVVWLCFLAALYALWRATERGSAFSAALAGGFLGLATLARSNVIATLPALLLALALPEVSRRRAKAAALLVAFALVVAPWAVRNARVTGSPTFSLHSYFLVAANSAPGESKRDYSLPWVRDFVSPLEYARAHPDLVWAKWRDNATAVATRYPWFAGTGLLSLLPWLALWRRIGGALQPIAVATCTGFVANALLCSLTDANPERYSLYLLAPMILLAAAVAWRGLRALPWRGARGPLLLALAIAAARPAGLVETRRALAAGAAATPPSDEMAFVAAHTAPDAVVFSDASHFVTWLTARRSIRFHLAPGPDGAPHLAVLEMDDDFGPIDAVYVSKNFLVDRGQGELLRRLEAEPRFAERFRCAPPLSGGGVFCARRSTPQP